MRLHCQRINIVTIPPAFLRTGETKGFPNFTKNKSKMYNEC